MNYTRVKLVFIRRRYIILDGDYMKAIEYLIKEHDQISRFLDRLEEECLIILKEKKINEDFFRASISFIREFADGIHHKKEEDILFKYMIDELGPLGEKLIKGGMLVEHQIARGYVYNLEISLNSYLINPSDKTILQILANSMAYVNLLRSHIDKENSTVYSFAEGNLEDRIKEKIEEESENRVKKERENDYRKEELLNIIFKKKVD